MPADLLVLQACVVDLERRRVRRADGSDESLTEQELGLLSYLADRPGTTVPRDELLQHVWGYSPHTVTRAVDIAVRRLRQKIERDASAPEHIVAARGVGYRFEPAERIPEPGAADSHLPFEHSSFIGRADDVRRLEELLQGSSRLATVTGPPGAGKSRLAVRVANGLRDRGDDVLYVPLSPARDAVDLVARMAGALGVRLGRGMDPDTAISVALRARGASLVVFDDAEHLVEPLSRAISEWLRQAGALRVLVTSRERLRVDGQAVVTLGPLSDDESAALLIERARAMSPSWGEEAASTVAAIVERLDGNPLALELAAARAEVLGPDALLVALDERFRLLGGPGRDDRQATLHRAIAWSWSLLTPWERSALAQCSVFEGGLSVAAAAEVLDLAAHPDAPWVLDQLQALVGRSMMEVRPGGMGRFYVAHSIRAFALEAAESDEVDAARQRHRDVFLRFGELHRGPLRGDDGARHLRALQQEAPNLRAAFRTALDTDADAAARIALVLDDVHSFGGSLPDRAGSLDSALAAGPNRRLYAQLLMARSRPRFLTGDAEGALQDAREGQRIAVELADAGLERRALLAIGQLCAESGDWEGAREHAVRCAESARAAGDTWYEARALLLQTALAFDKRDHEAQARHLDRLETLVGGRSNVLSAMARHLAGRLATSQGSEALAIARFRDALALADRIGDDQRAALVEADLACELCLVGELQEAVPHFRRSIEVHQRMGNRRSAMRQAGNLGHILLLLGHTDEAVSMLDEAVADARELGGGRGVGPRASSLGVALLGAGRYALAREVLEEALGLLVTHGRADSMARHSAYAALACVGVGDAEAARDHAAVARPPPFTQIAEAAVAIVEGRTDDARAFASALASRDREAAGFLGSQSWEIVVPEELDLAARIIGELATNGAEAP